MEKTVLLGAIHKLMNLKMNPFLTLQYLKINYSTEHKYRKLFGNNHLGFKVGINVHNDTRIYVNLSTNLKRKLEEFKDCLKQSDHRELTLM